MIASSSCLTTATASFRRRTTRSLVGVLTSIALLCPTAPASAALAPTLAATAATASAATLSSDIRAYLATRPGSRTSVYITDLNTGAAYGYATARRYDSASVVKVAIMAAVLRRAKDANRAPTTTEKSLMKSMITLSDNAATTKLWNRIGGGPGLTRLLNLAGMTSTVAASGVTWGRTQINTPDQVRLLRHIMRPSSLLRLEDRIYARSLMGSIVSWQRWGITAGVSPGTVVQLKNGWVWRSIDNRWRVHSVGRVKGDGRNYIIAVLTDRNCSEPGDTCSSRMDYGQETIKGVSRLAWRNLG